MVRLPSVMTPWLRDPRDNCDVTSDIWCHAAWPCPVMWESPHLTHDTWQERRGGVRTVREGSTWVGHPRWWSRSRAGDVLLSDQMKETARFDECRDWPNSVKIFVMWMFSRLYFQLDFQIHFTFNNCFTVSSGFELFSKRITSECDCCSCSETQCGVEAEVTRWLWRSCVLCDARCNYLTN